MAESLVRAGLLRRLGYCSFDFYQVNLAACMFRGLVKDVLNVLLYRLRSVTDKIKTSQNSQAKLRFVEDV